MRKAKLTIAAVSLAAALYADRAGDFDYFVLALSWNEGWCALEGEKKGAPQCDEQRGFTLHGLWPQYEEGWPEFCQTSKPNPSRTQTAKQAELFGTSGSAWHQWNKHGRCTGLSHEDYYALSKDAFQAFEQPKVLLELPKAFEVPVEVIEDAIIEANPTYSRDGISVVCRNGLLTEVRICFDRALEPQACLGRTVQDCSYAPEILPIE